MTSTIDMQLIYRQAEVVRALAHPIRIAIASLLREGECCVCDLADRIGAERSNVSRHLSIMFKSGVVHSRKEGVTVYYELRTPCILNFLDCATEVLRHNLEEDMKALEALE